MPAPTTPAPLDAIPVVTFTRSHDGDAWHCRLGAYQGPPRAERHAAQADADALAAALAPLAGVAARVEALLASPEARDAVAGRCAAPASAALAVLRWVRGGAVERDDEDVLHPGDAPTLDRLITGAGCAIVCGEEDPS